MAFMAAMAPLAKVATIGLSLGSTLMSGYGQMMQGQAEFDAANSEADQRDIQAGQERAVGQHNAARMRDEAKRLLSRQRAGLASSGFDATDATSRALTGDTVQASTIEELLELAQSEERARAMDYSAKMRRWEGRNAKRAAKVGAGATLLSGLVSAGSMVGGTGGKIGGAMRVKSTTAAVSKGGR